MITLLAVILSAGIVAAALPFFNEVAAKELAFAALFQPGFLLPLAGLGFAVGLFAGSYPAFVLSRFRPAEVLKGSFKSTGRGVRLRQGLIIFQFAVSVTLIVATLVVFRQLHYMQDRHLGFDREQVVVVSGAGIPEMARRYEAVKTELKRIPAVQEVSTSNVVPGRGNWDSIVSADHLPESESRSMQIVVVDHDYPKAMGLTLVAGRFLSTALESDAQESLLLNESAVESLGLPSPEEALGKEIRFLGERSATVVGVVEDYHHQSLRDEIEPMIMCVIPSAFQYFSVRFTTRDVSGLVSDLEALWGRLFPGFPFEYFFLDDDFNRQYRTEQQLTAIFGTFASQAVFIACLGLFGLVSFITAQRTKEIGVRKVLGAGIPSLIRLLASDFVKLVLISILIAAPLAYLGMQRWLDGFAYRMPFGPEIILLCGALVLLIALLTVSYQTIKAALADPVKSLRYE